MYCFVLHIGIYLYCKNSKETHKSCACFQHANTSSGRMFGRGCMLKASTKLECVYIYQYVTQNSTFTRQNTLSFIILVLITMFTLVSGVHECNKVILMDSIQQAWLAQLVGHQTSNLRAEGSSLDVGKNFSFCILSFSTRS